MPGDLFPGGGNTDLGGGNVFNPQATPELDSLTLLAAGFAGFGSYAAVRWRARGRRDADGTDAGEGQGEPSQN